MPSSQVQVNAAALSTPGCSRLTKRCKTQTEGLQCNNRDKTYIQQHMNSTYGQFLQQCLCCAVLCLRLHNAIEALPSCSHYIGMLAADAQPYLGRSTWLLGSCLLPLGAYSSRPGGPARGAGPSLGVGSCTGAAGLLKLAGCCCCGCLLATCGLNCCDGVALTLPPLGVSLLPVPLCGTASCLAARWLGTGAVLYLSGGSA